MDQVSGGSNRVGDSEGMSMTSSKVESERSVQTANVDCV